METRNPLIVAMTGASGALYGIRLMRHLHEINHPFHMVISEAARQVIEYELQVSLDLRDGDSICQRLFGELSKTVVYHHYSDLEAPIASGSYRTGAMIVVPCSMGTLGRIAGGGSSNLIDRAADVMLKERRKLILVQRETPLSEIHLENMLRVTRAGAIVMPASPGFYGYPERVSELVDFMVARILDHVGVPNSLCARYGGEKVEKTSD